MVLVNDPLVAPVSFSLDLTIVTSLNLGLMSVFFLGIPHLIRVTNVFLLLENSLSLRMLFSMKSNFLIQICFCLPLSLIHILITPSLSFPLPVLFLNLLLLFPPLAFLLLVLLLLILLQLIQIPSLVLLSMLSPTIDAGSTSVQDNSSDLSPSEVSNSAALEIVPTVNSHPMQTRSKSGIHLPT